MSYDASLATGQVAIEGLPEALEGYPVAFRGAPWFENTKCADELVRCVRGFSPLDNGEECGICGIAQRMPAYQVSELVEKFEAIFSSRLAALYTERVDQRVALTSVSWRGNVEVVASERYGANNETGANEMSWFLDNQIGDQPLVWLDEVFANFEVRGSGNLARFGQMTRSIAGLLDVSRVAFRSVNPAMITPAIRDFGRYAKLYQPLIEVPDSRTFVLINTSGVAR